MVMRSMLRLSTMANAIGTPMRTLAAKPVSTDMSV